MHDFDQSLALSHQAENLPIWESCYRQFFPHFLGMHNHRQDGDHQRLGIDRTVITTHGKSFKIDEKVRFVDYNDIALEEWSNAQRQIKGWIQKPLDCDFIAYAILPKGQAYLLPVPQLQNAWVRNSEQWKKDYGTRSSPNYCKRSGHSWSTIICPVPIPILFEELASCSVAVFVPIANCQEITPKQLQLIP